MHISRYLITYLYEAFHCFCAFLFLRMFPEFSPESMTQFSSLMLYIYEYPLHMYTILCISRLEESYYLSVMSDDPEESLRVYDLLYECSWLMPREKCLILCFCISLSICDRFQTALKKYCHIEHL